MPNNAADAEHVLSAKNVSGFYSSATKQEQNQEVVKKEKKILPTKQYVYGKKLKSS